MDEIILRSHRINGNPDKEPADDTEESSNSNSAPPPKRGRPKKAVTPPATRDPTPEPSPAPPPPKTTTFRPTPASSSGKSKSKADDKGLLRREKERKIRMYNKNPRLRKMLGDMFIPDNLQRLSDKEIDDLYSEIQDLLNFSFRDTYATGIFNMCFTGVEKACELFVKDVEWKGLAEFAADQENREEFEPELSEMAIELSDSLIPSAKWRLLLKIVNFTVAYRELIQKGWVPPGKNKGKQPLKAPSGEERYDQQSWHPSRRKFNEEARRKEDEGDDDEEEAEDI